MALIPDLDYYFPLIFFSRHQKQNQKNHFIKECTHLGYLIRDGFNYVHGLRTQRVRCSACQKRFGINASLNDLLSYQTQLKRLLYDLFFTRCTETEASIRWKIPQPKLSQFKKRIVEQIIHEHPDLLHTATPALPKGLIQADETYMGKMKNSNTEIHMINANYQTIATGSALNGQLTKAIQKVFQQISAEYRQKLRILITDGEPSYSTLALQQGERVIHVQQLHAKPLLGQVIINKYEKYGPHHLHYIIKTHWKAFKQVSSSLHFQWEIKLIKGLIQSKRGRPRLEQEATLGLQQWRQKQERYNASSFKKKGEASVFINLETGKISKRAGASQ